MTGISEATRQTAIPSAPPPLEVSEAHLANGLRIVVIPDHRAPIVTHMVWYRNGSADDPIGKSGIAHFLEHLMFKGTNANPAGSFSAQLSGIGGEENAFTSHDHTAYHQRVPREHLGLCMRYEADRMKNLSFSTHVVAPERDVVLEERRMRVDASPDNILGEAMMATLFTAHPYGRPIIGWQHEIEGLDKRDAFAYYERFYKPENAILVVAGDTDAEEVLALAEATYGMIAPSGKLPTRQRVKEPRAATHRRVSLANEKVGQPVFQRLHTVPSYGTGRSGEAEALEVLSSVLGAGQTSVLFRELVVGRKLAVSSGAFYSGHMLDEGWFGLYALPAPGIALDVIEEAINAILVELSRTGFEKADIVRAKTRLVANAIYAQDNAASQAERYGAALARGEDIERLAGWPARIEAVDDASIDAALSRLRPETGVSGHLNKTSRSV